MKTSQILTAAVAVLGFASSTVAQKGGKAGGGGFKGKGGAGVSSAAAAVSTGAAATANTTTTTTTTSTDTGSTTGGDNPLLLLASNVQNGSDSVGGAGDAGQALSATDPANFINFCTGKTLTNGDQVTGGSCNGVVMGDIPSNNNMISAIVLFPGPGDDITPNQTFNISVQITNLVAGSFTDPLTTYYSAPQQLEGGNVVGHCHVTVQDLGGDIAPTTPPDPKVFAFFKGINDAGNGQGLLQAVVTNGLPAGVYRVCTMNSASNHQPVLMPVAQRGAQDDCTKFTVGQGTGTDTGAAASASAPAAAASATAVAAAGTGAATNTTTTTTTGTGAAAGKGAGGKPPAGRGGRGGQGGRGRFGRGRGRFAVRDFIA